MSNVLNEAKKQQVIALGRLGWPLRRIEQETGVRRETVGAYLKAAGIGVRPAGGWGRRAASKPANEVITDSADSKPANGPGVITDFIGPFSEKPPPSRREIAAVSGSCPKSCRQIPTDWVLCDTPAPEIPANLNSDCAVIPF